MTLRYGTAKTLSPAMQGKHLGTRALGQKGLQQASPEKPSNKQRLKGITTFGTSICKFIYYRSIIINASKNKHYKILISDDN